MASDGDTEEAVDTYWNKKQYEIGAFRLGFNVFRTIRRLCRVGVIFHDVLIFFTNVLGAGIRSELGL